LKKGDVMSKVRVNVVLGVALACGVTAFGFYHFTNKESTQVAELGLSNLDKHALQEQLAVYKAKEENDARLGQYAINAMYKAGAKDRLSDAKKQILARAIVRVANDIFDTEDNKKAFIAVLAIESGFNRFAQSPTGPKGYAQLARASFHEAMKDCGVENLKDDDVWETDLNLYAGACYFKKILEANGGDPYMAIIGYNQGPNSEALKSYSKYGSMDNLEALKYVAKFTFLKRSITDQKQPGVPAIEELKTPKTSVEPKK
jgi:soluble lytic murein transglycosylase-like protein